MDEITELQESINTAVARFRDARTQMQVLLTVSDDIDGPVNELLKARELAKKSVNSAVALYMKKTASKSTSRACLVDP